MANKKQLQKYAKYELPRLKRIKELIEAELNRLINSNYRDLRLVFATAEEIQSINTSGCDWGSINVEYYFGTVENSPVDGFGILSIQEILKYLDKQIRYFTKHHPNSDSV
jgi:hypothetical protein